MTPLRRNAAFLYLSFVTTALVNVTPQAYFAREAPEAKGTLLSATLLLGTLAAVAGVAVGRRGFGRWPWAAPAAGLAALALAQLASPFAPGVPVFLALHLALRFGTNYLTLELDRRSVSLAGAAGRAGNDLAGLALRFGGMLLAPAYFALVDERGPGALLIVLGLGLPALGSARVLSGAPEGDAAGPSAGAPPSRGDALLLWSARLTWATYSLLGASAGYLLSDLHGLADARVRGGLLVTVVYGAAVVATVGQGALRLGPGRPRAMALAPLVVLGVGLALSSVAAANWGAELAAAALLGMAFARCLGAFREHVTRRVLHAGRDRLLAQYNNLGNTSALVGFGAMFALVQSAKALGLPSAPAIVAGVVALPLGALPLLVLGARAAQAEDALALGDAGSPVLRESGTPGPRG